MALTKDLRQNGDAGLSGAVFRTHAVGNGSSVMISDWNIYRAASLLINLHGFDAMVEAAKVLDVSLDRVDPEARLVWSRVKAAIEALQSRSTGTVH